MNLVKASNVKTSTNKKFKAGVSAAAGKVQHGVGAVDDSAGADTGASVSKTRRRTEAIISLITDPATLESLLRFVHGRREGLSELAALYIVAAWVQPPPSPLAIAE